MTRVMRPWADIGSWINHPEHGLTWTIRLRLDNRGYCAAELHSHHGVVFPSTSQQGPMEHMVEGNISVRSL